tara:strand:+ start:1896 stop:2093 length:198 start_codon:yes stop_codon:yes gene_type:complete
MNNLWLGWAFINITDKGEVPCNIRKVGKKTSIVEIPKQPTSPLSIDHFDTHEVPNDCLTMDIDLT